MSKATESIELPLGIDAVGPIIMEVLATGKWRIYDIDRASFYVREQSDLFSRMFHYPSKVAIFLHEQSEHETRIALHGSIFGFGPMQKARVRKVVAKLRQTLETAFEESAGAAND